MKYDFTADLTGIGDRSEYKICEVYSNLTCYVTSIRTLRCLTFASVKLVELSVYEVLINEKTATEDKVT